MQRKNVRFPLCLTAGFAAFIAVVFGIGLNASAEGSGGQFAAIADGSAMEACVDAAALSAMDAGRFTRVVAAVLPISCKSGEVKALGIPTTMNGMVSLSVEVGGIGGTIVVGHGSDKEALFRDVAAKVADVLKRLAVDPEARAKACAYVIHATLGWASDHGGIASPALESLRDVGCTGPEVTEAARRNAVVKLAAAQIAGQHAANWGDKVPADKKKDVPPAAPQLGGKKVQAVFVDSVEPGLAFYDNNPSADEDELRGLLVRETHQKIIDRVFELGGEPVENRDPTNPDAVVAADIKVVVELVAMPRGTVVSPSTPCPWRRVTVTTSGMSPNIQEKGGRCNNDPVVALDKLLGRVMTAKSATSSVPLVPPLLPMPPPPVR